MLKFFRGIRRKLLDESSLKKYMVYAMGEILLVMIGILLALQVNNWNENRKSRAELREISQNLRAEFESNLGELEEVLNEVQSSKEGSLQLLELFGASEPAISRFDLDSLIEFSFLFPIWEPSTYVLSELKSSGKLALIEDNKLKELLFKWERQYTYTQSWNRRMEESGQRVINYIRENGSLRNVNYYRLSIDRSKLNASNKGLLQDSVFEDYIDEKAVYSQFLEEAYLQIILIANEIIKELE